MICSGTIVRQNRELEDTHDTGLHIAVDDRLTTFIQLQEQPTASTDQVNDLQQWLAARPNVVEDAEQDFAYHKDDLISARAQVEHEPKRWMTVILQVSWLALPLSLFSALLSAYYSTRVALHGP